MYNNQIRAILLDLLLINFLILAFSLRKYIDVVFLILVSFIEIVYLIYGIKKVCNIQWLKLYGISKYIGIENVTEKRKVIRTRTGSWVHVCIESSEECVPGYYKGEIRVPYTCYPAFQEAFKECKSIEVKINPQNPDNYYMCLEKVAQLRWIPNNCEIVLVNKYIMLILFVLNIAIIALGFNFL